MDLTTLIVLGFFVLACILAIYESRTNNWNLNQNVGTIIFLIGAAIGMFLDDFLPTDSPTQPWVEPVAAAIVLIGWFIFSYWNPES